MPGYDDGACEGLLRAYNPRWWPKPPGPRGLPGGDAAALTAAAETTYAEMSDNCMVVD